MNPLDKVSIKYRVGSISSTTLHQAEKFARDKQSSLLGPFVSYKAVGSVLNTTPGIYNNECSLQLTNKHNKLENSYITLVWKGFSRIDTY
jgi:hypothetical protein